MEKENLNSYLKDKYLIQMLLDGIGVGLFSGTIAILYRYMITKLDLVRFFIYGHFIGIKVLLIFLMAIVFGLIMAFLLKRFPLSGGSGIPQIRGELLGRLSMNEWGILSSKFVGGGLANVIGLSLGREGPSIQIGGAVAKIFAKVLKRDNSQTNYIITAGASAGLAAAFNAPISGALFAMEEMHKSFSSYIFVPALISSVTANFLSFLFLGQESSFNFKNISPIPVDYILLVLVLGILCGIVGAIFNNGLNFSIKKFGMIKSNYVRLPITLFIGSLVGLFFYDLTGGGHFIVEELANESFTIKFLLLLLIGKLLFTFFSYGSGAQGGIFLPTLVIGALLGCVYFKILNSFIDISQFKINFLILGMAGVLCGVVRSPLLSIMLVTEMSGSLNQFILVSVVSMAAYFTCELLKVEPIYESLYEGIMKKFSNKPLKESEDYQVFEYIIPFNFKDRNKTLTEIDFPVHLIIASITREGRNFIPKSDDIIKEGDILIVLIRNKDMYIVDEYFKS